MVDVRLMGKTDVEAELARLRETPVNYELTAPPSREQGWDVDEYCLRLPGEAPGDPEPDGPYEVACRLVRDYEFADPAIIRAVWPTAGSSPATCCSRAASSSCGSCSACASRP